MIKLNPKGEKMKKILIALILILGFILTFTNKIGAQMDNNFTEVRAEHILVETEKEAIEIKKQIENKEITFEDAAKKYSKCPSKANGGDLGYFGKGMMVKEFEKAAFEAPESTITNPVETQFGWHLIKIIDKR